VELLNVFGRWLGPRLLQMSLELAILAAVVVVAIRLLRIKSPALRHLFWCLVLAKPVAMFLVASPVSLYWFLKPPVEMIPPPAPAVAEISQVPMTMERLPADIPARAYRTPSAAAVAPEPPWRKLDLRGLGGLCWLVVASALGLRLITGFAYVGFLRHTAVVRREGPLADIVRHASESLKLRRRVTVSISNVTHGPVLAGVFRPVILLPKPLTDELSQEQLRHVITHELAHVRRWDNLVLVLQRLAEMFLFFHPVVWLCGWLMRREAEAACDDAVIAAQGRLTGGREDAAYADSLTRVAEMRCGITRRLLVNTFAAAESNFAYRVRRLMKGRVSRMTVGVTVASAVALILIGLVGLPTAARTKKPGPSETADAPSSPGPTVPLAQDRSPAERDMSTTASSTAPDIPLETKDGVRILHFPKDSSLGYLSILRQPRSKTYRLGRTGGAAVWEYLCEAQGDVAVPVGERLRLYVGTRGLQDLDQLSNLGPYDLHTLAFDLWPERPENATYNDDDTIMRHIQGLKGLKVLKLHFVQTTGQGLEFIKDFKSLTELHLSSKNLADSDLSHLQGLRSLEVLNLFVPISDGALQYLAGLTSLRELSLKCDNIRGSGLAYLADIPSLRLLELRGDGLRNRALRYLEDVESLSRLVLFNSRNINDAAMPYVAKLEHLDELSILHISGITDAGMLYLRDLRSLRRLDLGSTRITDRGLVHLPALRNLEYLTLPLPIGARHGVTDAALAYVAELPRLRFLDARGWTPVLTTDPGPFTDEGLRLLAGITRLEELSIASGAGITDGGMAHIARLPGLNRLSLMTNGVTSDGLAHLATMKSLERLALSFPNVDTVAVAGVNHLNALTNLKNLDVSDVVQDHAGLDLSSLKRLERLSIMIGNRGPKHRKQAYRDEDLASLDNLTRLVSLQFGNSPAFTDAGMAHIANLNALERLFIGGPKVTDKGLTYLAGKQALYQLGLQGDFTDQGLRQLESIKSLRYLTIDSTRGLSRETEDRLRRSLPNLYSFNRPPLVGGAFGGGHQQ